MANHHYTCSAEWEFVRLKGAHAWSPHPISSVKRRWRNQYWSHYWFADGSRLDIYNSGKATWHSPDGCRHISTSENEYHSCNAQGV